MENIKNIEIKGYTVKLTINHLGEYNSTIFHKNRVVAAIMDLRDLSMGFCPVPHVEQELSELEAIDLHIKAIKVYSSIY